MHTSGPGVVLSHPPEPDHNRRKDLKQKAYRQRLKERGLRVVSVVVKDVRDQEQPLRSDIIDLSEVRQVRRQR